MSHDHHITVAERQAKLAKLAKSFLRWAAFAMLISALTLFAALLVIRQILIHSN